MTKCLMYVATAILVSGNIAGALSIYDVQYSDAAGGWISQHTDQIVDVTGGVVIYVGRPPGKFATRVVIQDPSFAEWGGVEIKIFDGTLGDAVQLGDQVNLTNVYVDESSATRGTTYLLFDATTYGSAFTIASAGHVIPPTVISPSVLGAGEQSANPAQTEKYEGMLLTAQSVTIGSMGLGSHNDNYELTGAGGTCWATDYFNLDRDATQLYHPFTEPGRPYWGVIGVLQQYTKISDQYDYYQLMTRSSADFVPEPGVVAFLLAGATAVLGKRKHGVTARRP
ncbi:MAG: hypothetical protein KAX78_10015 [Phycisphaerae bacterium]|nr:hypothetical protein [Phycisphaerae bacterium]